MTQMFKKIESANMFCIHEERRYYRASKMLFIFNYRMHGEYSPVSSEDQQYEDPPSPLHLDEKADRILTMQSLKGTHDLTGSSASSEATNASPIRTGDIQLSTTAMMLESSKSSNETSVPKKPSQITSYQSAAISVGAWYQPLDFASPVIDIQHSKPFNDRVPVNFVNEFDVNEAAKRLSMTMSGSPKVTFSQKKGKKDLQEMDGSAVRFHSNYQRHPKPPYPYTGMIIHAITSAPEKCLTLSGINHRLEEMFDFFKGPYKGWKDSVRHNLSHNACFVKGGRCTEPESKGNLWYVDISKAPINCFKLQDTPVARQGNWAQELHIQLGLAEIPIPSKKPTSPVSLHARKFPWDINNSSSVVSGVAFNSSSHGSDSVYPVPLSATPVSTVNEEFSVAPNNESFSESREVPAFLSDASFEGSIKTRKVSRQSRRNNSVWNKRSREDLMKTIARKAARKMTSETPIQNFSLLCQSPHFTQNETYSNPPNDTHPYHQHQYFPEPNFFRQSTKHMPNYDHSPFQSFLYQSDGPNFEYPKAPTIDIQQQNYPGYPYFPAQPLDPYHTAASWNNTSYQLLYQQKAIYDPTTPVMTFLSQKSDPVDFSHTISSQQELPNDSSYVEVEEVDE